MDSLIENVHKLLTEGESGPIHSFTLYRRLYALSVIAYIHEVNNKLEELSNRLDFELDFLALEIQYDKYLQRDYWEKGWLLNNYNFIETNIPACEINQYTDYLPNGVDGYSFNSDMVKTFKDNLYQICDETRLTWGDIHYAVRTGFNKMISLLSSIKKKTQNPPPHLFTKFWTDLVVCTDGEDLLIDYSIWKEEQGDISFQRLKDKQTQIIVDALSTGFLHFRPIPTKRDVENCKLTIDEDALETGYVLPENIKEQCARFEYFISWNDPDKNILSLDYEKLGKYCYDHYKLLGDDLNKFIDFDILLDAIHEDMAKLKPNLEKYLKNYEEKTIKDLHKECAEILNCCQKHLKEGVRSTFFEEFLGKMLYDKDIKQEAREKLSSTKFRNKYLCQIIAALDCFYIFRVDVIKSDLANTLGKKLVKPNRESICDYIEDFQRERNGALYNWTYNIIDDLKTTPFKYPSGLL